MMCLGGFPRAKNVIPESLTVNMSCQRTYGREKATTLAVAFVDVLLYFQCSESRGLIWQNSAPGS
jgi:hypothetical protein